MAFDNYNKIRLGVDNDTNQTIFTIPEYHPPPICQLQFYGHKNNDKKQPITETFDIKQMYEENKASKLRVQKLETWFDHIRQKSSLIDEFIKTADEVLKREAEEEGVSLE